MQIHRHLLLAADFWEAIVPLIVMVLWALGQLMGGKPKAKRPAPPGGGGGAPSLEETLRREIEQFKRRAEGRPAEAPKRPQIPAGKREPRPARPAADRPVRRLPDTSRPPIAPAASAPHEPMPPRTPPTGAGVGQHVAQHLSGAREMAAHVQQLGADVALADERMQEHLQQRFAHQLGALERRGTTTQTGAVRSPAAQELLQLLSQPAGIRQAIIASEILRRPDQRWERTKT